VPFRSAPRLAYVARGSRLAPVYRSRPAPIAPQTWRWRSRTRHHDKRLRTSVDRMKASAPCSSTASLSCARMAACSGPSFGRRL